MWGDLFSHVSRVSREDYQQKGIVRNASVCLDFGLCLPEKDFEVLVGFRDVECRIWGWRLGILRG